MLAAVAGGVHGVVKVVVSLNVGEVEHLSWVQNMYTVGSTHTEQSGAAGQF
jgi:hypothetical protein